MEHGYQTAAQTGFSSAAAPDLGPLLQALLDELACGLIVCDGLGFMRLSNTAAQQELAHGGLLVGDQGRLVHLAGSGGDLGEALRLAVQRGRRSLVRLAQGDNRLMLSVVPLPGDGGAPTQVLVMLGRRQACSDLGLEMLASSHGLTMTERKVLAGLLHGKTPNDIARQHRVAVCTVRTQILAVRAKLGVRSIEAVLLRAAEVPPITHALRLAGFMAAPRRAAMPDTPPMHRAWPAAA